MENDVLKNKIAPWQEKGRWYHGIVDSATNDFIQEKTDSFLVNNFGLGNNAGFLYLRPENTSLYELNIVIKTKGTFSSSGVSYESAIYRYPDGRLARALGIAGPTAFIGTIEFWVFVVQN